MQAQSSPLRIAQWLGGPIVWAVHFLTVYTSESLICPRGGSSMHLALVGVATAVGLLALLALLAASWRAVPSPNRAGHGFMDQAAFSLTLLAIIGLLWVSLPAIILCACS
jgi:hypothetical protein